MELVDQLTRSLGVSPTQAQGGAGLLLKQAQENLGEGDFSKVSAAVPGIDSLIGAAPAAGGGALGGLGKMASGLGGGAGGLLSLAGGFSSLGMDSGMIGKFVPVVLSFVQSKGGDSAKAVLEKALK
ncbi:MAG: DUF2780 domain-containing protein [Dehalococcoidia bacterium]|nr:DUF2780 domain-containing protein [Dehalococcoidia bacterium]